MNKIRIEASITSLSDVGKKAIRVMAGLGLGITDITIPTDYVINYKTESNVDKKYLKELSNEFKEKLEKFEGITVHDVKCYKLK